MTNCFILATNVTEGRSTLHVFHVAENWFNEVLALFFNKAASFWKSVCLLQESLTLAEIYHE